jgi:putative ABC transport system permease protein
MTPPRLAQRLLGLALDHALADAVIGDLDEIFADEFRQGPWTAHYRYWRRTAGALWHLRGAPTRDRRRHAGDGIMTTTLRDFARGSRLFVTHPSFAWAAVVTLALAIGANTLIFTIANLLVLKPLPIAEPATLGWILGSTPVRTDRAGVSLPEFETFRNEITSLTRLAAWRRETATFRERDQSERVLSQRVIGDLQGQWGLKAVRGRTLNAGDEISGAPRVTVLSHRFWVTRYGSTDAIVGQSVLIDGEPHTVIGVLAPDIELGNLAEIVLWLPYQGNPAAESRADRGWRPTGRLAPGATLADANAQVVAVSDRISREFPDTNRDFAARVGSTREALGGANTWLVLSLLAIVVGLLLLLACANVMNLLIARLIGRRQELAVRTALGATRATVVRQIVSESLLLGLAGGLLGLGVAWAGLQAIHATASELFFQQLVLDYRVLLFAVLLSFVAPLAFSVLPTLRVLRDDVRATLNEGSTRTVGSASAARGRSSLVVLQVTLAVTLLIVAALVVQSMRAITAVDPGFDTSRLLAAQIDVASWKEPGEAAALRMRQRLLARVKELPGVEAAAFATEVPSLGYVGQVPFDIAGRPGADDRDRPRAGLTVVSDEYFATLGVPILVGRAFEAGDAVSPKAVTVISSEAARRFWDTPSEAIGSSIRIAVPDGEALDATVIGVSRSTADPDPTEVPVPVLFVLDEHRPARSTNILLRAANPAALAGPLRAAAASVDPDLPTYAIRTVAASIADENSSNRLLGGMFAAFAAVAILLAMAGLYGVMSYAVSQRSGEIAVRMALGAPARAIAGQVVGQSLKLVTIGVVLGTICAYGLARAIGSLLYGVTAHDPATYAGALALTATASLVASFLPMRRAAGIDPLESLRQR